MFERSFVHRDQAPDLDIPGAVKKKRTEDVKEGRWRRANKSSARLCANFCPSDIVGKLKGRWLCEECFKRAC